MGRKASHSSLEDDYNFWLRVHSRLEAEYNSYPEHILACFEGTCDCEGKCLIRANQHKKLTRIREELDNAEQALNFVEYFLEDEQLDYVTGDIVYEP